MASNKTLQLRTIKPLTTFLGEYEFLPAPHDSWTFKYSKIKGQYVRKFKAGDVITSRDKITKYICAPDGSLVRLPKEY